MSNLIEIEVLVSQIEHIAVRKSCSRYLYAISEAQPQVDLALIVENLGEINTGRANFLRDYLLSLAQNLEEPLGQPLIRYKFWELAAIW